LAENGVALMARRRWAGSSQPVDDQLAEADIQDRLLLANTLRQRSMEGASLPNVGGHLVGSPWARALSSVAQGVQGEGERKRAYGMADDLATSKRERLAQALGGVGQEQTPEARLKRGMELMGHPDPQAQEVGRYMAESAQKEIEAGKARQEKQYGETNKDLRNMKTLMANEDLAKQKSKDARELAEWKFEHPAPSTAQPQLPAALLQELNYLHQFDAKPDDSPETAAMKKARRDEFWAGKRAQQVLDRGGSQDVLQPGAAPGTVAASLPKTLAPNQMPEHEFEMHAAGKQGEAAASLASQKAKAPGIIDEAKSLLEPAPGEQLPTQSGIGSAVDRIGGWFGMSPPGATEAARLKVVGGNLTSLVPRFEGPQSDRDTQAYREMAGQIGDDTIPVPQRLAALKQVETLINGYGGPAKVFGGGETPMAPPAPAAAAAPPPGIDPEDWKYLSPEEQAAFHQ